MGLGVFGVWVAMVIDWVVRAICFIIGTLQWKSETARAIIVNTEGLSFVLKDDLL